MNKSKKKLTIFALAVITLAFFAACVNPFFPKLKEKDSDGNRRTDDTLAVTIAAAFGPDGKQVTITADVTGDNGGTLSYQWYSNTVYTSGGWTELPNETEKSYEPPMDSAGTMYYYVEVTNVLSGKTFSAVSNTIGIVVHEDGTVEIIGSEIETPVVTIAVDKSDGGSVTLTASASVSDGGTLSYQWYANTDDYSAGGKELNGETGTTYTPPVNPDGAAYYYVKATNTLRGQTASAVSNTVKIVVQNNVIVIEEIVISDTVETPVVTVTAESGGSNVTLTAAASVSDGGTLSYQWYKNTVDSGGGTPVAGATGTSYTPPNIDGTAYYYVKATNTLRGQTASAVSNTVKVVVEDGEITEVVVSDPVAIPVVTITGSVNGRNVTLTAEASAADGGTLSYQWYRNTVQNAKNGSLIAGATGTTYAPRTTSPGTTYYYVKVTNTLKGQTAVAVSNILGVVVPEGAGPAEIIDASGVETPTVSITADVEGKNVTLTAKASASDGGTLSYQWYSRSDNNTNGTPVQGATGETYAPPTSSPGTTYYYVKATNTLDGKSASAFSNILGVVVPGPGGGGTIEILHVETPRVTISAAVAGSTVTLTADASVGDGGTLSYQWYSGSHNNTNGTPVQGATGITYQPPTSSPGTTYYYVVAINTLDGKTASAFSNTLGVVVPGPGGGGTGGGTIVVVEAELPSITIAASPAGPYGISATVMLTATVGSVSDGGTLSYRWYSNTTNSNTNGTIIQGATGLTYQPPTSSIGKQYYYCRATNTLNGKSAVAESNVVEIEVKVTEIRSATVTVTAPVKSATPASQANTSETDYTVGNVAWSSGGTAHTGAFLGNTAYTATVTLTAQQGYAFASSFAATINGTAATVSNNTNGSVTISLAFDATLDKTVSGVTITAPATKMTYVHGETLNLAGLTIKVTYNDATYDEGTLAALSAPDKLGTNIWADPANGEQLSRALHNGKPVVITAGGEKANTGNLTVNQKGLTAAAVSHTKPYDGTTTATGITVSSSTGKVSNDDVSIESATGIYTSADAGTKTLNITGGTLMGNDKENYTVAAVNGLTVDGGITKADSTVTWPTAAAITYGAALSTSALTGGAGAGLFAWTNGAAIPTVTNSGYQVTFTPTDTTNYNTLTHNVSITVNKATPTVTTWPTAATINYGAALSTSALSGGVGAGSFVWTNGTAIPTVNNSGYEVTFTPTDAANYNTLTHNVNITVNKATPTVTTWPTGFTAGYGSTLSQITISGGSASVDGTFTWTTPTTLVGALGTQAHNMTFTPTDTNYNTLTQNVNITVNKADPTVRWPSSLTATYGQTLADVPARGNGTGAGTFTWTTPSTPVGNAYGGYRSHNMTFTPNDTANYNTITNNVLVNVRPKTITLTVLTLPDPSRTLIPIGGDPVYSNTTTFDINVSGLIGDEMVSASSGFALIGESSLFSDGDTKTVTMEYIGDSSENSDSPALRTVTLFFDTSNYTLDSNPTVSVNVIDGVTADRTIPITQSNITGFNTAFTNRSADRHRYRRYYKLMEDVTAPTTWTPIGSAAAPFTGSFDGQGHTITGLQDAMFYRLGGSGIIKNLGLKNVNINNSTSNYVGGVVGHMFDEILSPTVQNCFVTGSVTSTSAFIAFIGGVVGYMPTGTVQDCYSTANVSGTRTGGPNSYIVAVGGVVGYTNNPLSFTVQNCYATGSVNGSSPPTGAAAVSVYAGGVVGGVASLGGTKTITNCVALNSLINATNENISTGIIGRVYNDNGTPNTSTYNYGRTEMTMTSNGANVTPTSDASGKDGADTSTWNTQTFWTDANNWDGTAWDFTNVWEWNGTLQRPILRGFATGAQEE